MSYSVAKCCRSFETKSTGKERLCPYSGHENLAGPKGRKHRFPSELCGKIGYCLWPPNLFLLSNRPAVKTKCVKDGKHKTMKTSQMATKRDGVWNCGNHGNHRNDETRGKPTFFPHFPPLSPLSPLHSPTTSPLFPSPFLPPCLTPGGRAPKYRTKGCSRY